MKTYSAKLSEIKREWHVIDAEGKILGKLATEAAMLLMGKTKPMYSPNLDVGDYVIVINAEKIKVTGDKLRQKMYYHHSNYPGGLKSVNLEKLRQTYPTRVIEHAVRGMIPRNRLGESMMGKLKVYAGSAHPHQAQVGVEQ